MLTKVLTKTKDWLKTNKQANGIKTATTTTKNTN